jgi:hypothetical protein
VELACVRTIVGGGAERSREENNQGEDVEEAAHREHRGCRLRECPRCADGSFSKKGVEMNAKMVLLPLDSAIEDVSPVPHSRHPLSFTYAERQ